MKLFKEKMKQAMQELGLNQKNVCDLTGKSKGSVSQYLSGKQIPSENVQSDIAVALGLAPDYFNVKPVERQSLEPKCKRGSNTLVPKLTVKTVAKMMGLNHETLKKALKQERYPWGVAICMTPDVENEEERRYRYDINARRFAEYERVPWEEVEPWIK